MIDLTRTGAVDAIVAELRPARLYQGRRTADGCEVWAEARRLTPVLSQQVWNHSPDGFEWGYAGSGPAQLALALLLDTRLRVALATQLHQDFKFAFVAKWKQQESWALAGEDLVQWIKAALAEIQVLQRGRTVQGETDA